MRSRGAHVVSVIVVLLTCLAMVGREAAAIPAFPGAEGFGANATGGRGGEVFHVDNLANTSTGSYQGSNGYNHGTLRWCLTTETSSLPRTIVFDVGGQVTLASQISVENSNMTVAGQTAPGQGLTMAGRHLFIESSNNLVVRHIRSRLGQSGGSQDSISIEGNNNMIFDHVTTSWSGDEGLSVAKTGNNVTVQNSFIYEALNNAQHSYGSLIRPEISSNVTYHHNLYADNKSRNPRPGTYNNQTLNFDFRNNVIYNWSDRAGYIGGAEQPATEYVNMNYVGNYAIAGPATPAGEKSSTAFTMDVKKFYSFDTDSVISNKDYIALQTYQAGNAIDSDHDATRDGTDTGWGMFISSGQGVDEDQTLTAPYPDFNYGPNSGLAAKRATPFNFASVVTQSADDAYDSVLDYAGSFWWNRDSSDTRIVNQVETNTGAIINHQDDVGGFPTLPVLTRDIAIWDTDYDGMPNFWEISRGLNPNLASDRNNDYDTDGYTNLEEYINEVGAWPAPRAISWNGGSGRFALNQNWDTWQPSQYDEVRIADGLATVDAVGQHAGRILLGTVADTHGMLSITSGWLAVEDTAEGVGDGAILIGANSLAKGSLFLSGGTLSASLLTKGNEFAAFEFTGGVLHADVVDFDLVNKGGTLAPGNSIGLTQVTGDLTLQSGVLEIDVGGTNPGQYDKVLVNDVTILGGTLRVVPVDLGGGIYVPQLGDQIGFLASGGGTGGAFEHFDLPALADGLEWAILPGDVTNFLAVVEATLLAGDYNDDGMVDAADYTVWRNNLASGTPLLNETASLGTVDHDDYAAWKANFGTTKLQGGGSVLTVPEPMAVAMWLGLLTPFILFSRRSAFSIGRQVP